MVTAGTGGRTITAGILARNLVDTAVYVGARYANYAGWLAIAVPDWEDVARYGDKVLKVELAP